MTTCSQCGLEHITSQGRPSCSSHRKRTDPKQPCGNDPLHGQTVCRMHGGSAPQNLAAAERRLARTEAYETVGELLAEAQVVIKGLPGYEQMLMGIHHAGSMALGYRWLLDALPVESDWSFTERHGGEGGAPVRWVNVDEVGLVGPNHQGEMKLHAYEEGFRHWTKLHAQLLKTAHDMGIEERKAALAEQQVAQVGDAIRALVEGLGRELDDPEVVPVVERSLRIVAGSA